MNRDQKAVAIAEIATQIDESEAIFAVDYRGITVAQVAELRAKLRESDATFKVVKNSLTERAADQVGADTLKEFLSGPTALTFVRGDVATAAKAVADYARITQLLPFKGGLMEGSTLDADQIRALSRLPSREVLYGQLVGVVASPITGLVRTLNALIGGLAVALGQVQAKKESGEVPAGASPAEAKAAEAPAAESEAAAPEVEETAEPAAAEDLPDEVARAEDTADAAPPAASSPEGEAPDAPTAEVETAAETAPAGEDVPDEVARAEDTAGGPPRAGNETEPGRGGPAQADDKQADVSAGAQPADAETNPKED